jgi:hypothetical protein
VKAHPGRGFPGAGALSSDLARPVSLMAPGAPWGRRAGGNGVHLQFKRVLCRIEVGFPRLGCRVRNVGPQFNVSGSLRGSEMFGGAHGGVAKGATCVGEARGGCGGTRMPKPESTVKALRGNVMYSGVPPVYECL